MSQPKDLTICTVSFRSQDYLNLGWELTRQLNNAGKHSWEWIVVENTPEGDPERLAPGDESFRILSGIDMTNVKSKYPAGYQHAAGLNKALSQVKSRYALILDPDFFVIRKNWISDLIEHMQRNHIVFLGSPYHPKWYMKIRYVPVAYCLLIDLEQVNRSDLDFIVRYPPEKEGGGKIKKSLPESLRKIFRPASHLLSWLIFNRKLIEAERDTGWHLYDKIKKVGTENYYKYECLIPVFHPSEDFTGKEHLPQALNEVIEKFLPDHRSYIPKKAGYFSQSGFKERGYADLNAREWEEYLWRGEPFGFHLRGYPKRDRDMRPEKEFLRDFLTQVMDLKHENLTAL